MNRRMKMTTARVVVSSPRRARPRPRLRLRPSLLVHLVLAVSAAAASTAGGAPGDRTSASNTPLVLRVRRLDGSVARVQVEGGGDAKLSRVLAIAEADADVGEGEAAPSSVILGTGGGRSRPLDTSRTVGELGLRHGSLISVVSTIVTDDDDNGEVKRRQRRAGEGGGGGGAHSSSSSATFDPFPELARQRYSAASRRTRALANSRRGLSYGDIERMASSMHEVEAQDVGAVKRIYMCPDGAERFRAGCIVKKNKGKKGEESAVKKKRKKGKEEEGGPAIQRRCALLFGTVARERSDPGRPVAARTSLSSTPSDRKMCDVVRVDAVWEPPQRSSVGSSPYDASKLLEFAGCPEVRRAVDLASRLNLAPVGWMFAYEARDGDAREDAGVPVLAGDVVVASILQGRVMEHMAVRGDGGSGGRGRGFGGFVTLALDAPTGATEAFQMSDRAVQMAAEGVLMRPSEDEYETARIIRTSDPVIVDGKETGEVDCVLCLVNTAMLSRNGNLSGVGTVKSSGNINSRTKKRLLATLSAEGGRQKSLEILCDFNLLYGLSKIMNDDDLDELCRSVVKWSSGQRKGTEISRHLQLVLESVLG